MERRPLSTLTFEPDGPVGLHEALQGALVRLGSRLVVDLSAPSSAWARVAHGPRSADVSASLDKRSFGLELWFHGVRFGRGWVDRLSDVAAVIHAFVDQGIGATALRERFGWLTVPGEAFLHEAGADGYVREAWKGLVAALEADVTAQARLAPLVRACSERPRLRTLMPYLAHGAFCLSRMTGEPFTCECPRVLALEDGRFRLEGAPVREGDAAAVAALLETLIAPDCAGAAHGTAEERVGED